MKRMTLLVGLVLTLTACKDSGGGAQAQATDLSGVEAKIATLESRLASTDSKVAELATAQGTYGELLAGVASVEDLDAVMALLVELEVKTNGLRDQVDRLINTEAQAGKCTTNQFIEGGYLLDNFGTPVGLVLRKAEIIYHAEPGGFYSTEPVVEVADEVTGNVIWRSSGERIWMDAPKQINELTGYNGWHWVCVNWEVPQ